MSWFNNGGPAFPKEGYQPQTGMTLWDYFAAHALSGFWSGEMNSLTSTHADATEFAAKAADAMIAERRKRMELK